MTTDLILPHLLCASEPGCRESARVKIDTRHGVPVVTPPGTLSWPTYSATCTNCGRRYCIDQRSELGRQIKEQQS